MINQAYSKCDMANNFEDQKPLATLILERIIAIGTN